MFLSTGSSGMTYFTLGKGHNKITVGVARNLVEEVEMEDGDDYVLM